MAESFAFQIAGEILGKLTSLAIHEIGLIWGVKYDLKRLQLTVSSIKAVLLDAADQKKKSRHIEDWLEKLQEVLCDVNDLLDDLMTEDLQRKVLTKGSKRKAVMNFFSSSNSLAIRVRTSKKIKKIRNRLEDIDADRKKFDLVEQVLDTKIISPIIRETHSFVRASEVIGREVDKNRIVRLLLNNSNSSGSSTSSVENIAVLPIVGLGGLGKTTLAKLVYNDEAIVSNFERRLWICASEEFNLKKLIVKIMEADTGGIDHAHLDLNHLQACLRTSLNSSKFLLVLDDVWNEDPKKWTDLKYLLNCGSHGSKVLVTTRKKTTAKIMGTLGLYELHGLSNEECVSIFCRCAFKEGEEKQYPKLLEIGKVIVMKCKGLPLAVTSVGSLLFTKREEHEWVHIRDTDIWEIPQKDDDVLPILKLSYDEMPMHLKRCFAYCAKFPKDFIISNVLLTEEWMANGLIQTPSDGRGQERLEDIGNQYFFELLSRSFLQIEAKYFTDFVVDVKMHDLVHDLARFVAGKEVLHFKNDTKMVYEGTRHLLFSAVKIERGEFPQSLLKLNKVRSFDFQYAVGPISKEFVNSIIETFKYLRILSLSGSEFEELPSSIGSLKHLRFLGLYKNMKIKALPNTICKLVNLQTLDFDGCLMVQCLPRGLGNLWSLRNLRLTCQMKGGFPKNGLAEGLCSLQFLMIKSCYNLEKLSKGMRNLTTLRQLYISDCPNLTSLPTETMKHLTSLEHLVIKNCEKLNLFEEESKTMEMPRSLVALTLWGLSELKELPCGFERISPSIKYVSIRNCSSFEILPEWFKECTSLKRLRLGNCSPNLKEKCARETGQYWHLISHIPRVEIG